MMARKATSTPNQMTNVSFCLRIPLSMSERRINGFTATITASRMTTGTKTARIFR